MTNPTNSDTSWAKAAVAAVIARCVRSCIDKLEADAQALKKWGVK